MHTHTHMHAHTTILVLVNKLKEGNSKEEVKGPPPRKLTVTEGTFLYRLIRSKGLNFRMKHVN